MHEKDTGKTASNIQHGHYRFLGLPFGLKNAPALNQRVMDNLLMGLYNEELLVYLDDVLISSTSLQEQLKQLSNVFQRLRETTFKIQPAGVKSQN